MRSRLRRVRATMVSGPDVLASRSRWRMLHLRSDRAAFGNTGPARQGPSWTHLAAALLGAFIMLAFAGVHA
ncbi:hypothetical protein CA234_02970 [Sphingomonas sp. ABOLE]|nr:hypothetical protein CA234_02970 [Sphingomonas sp. ABOLE]